MTIADRVLERRTALGMTQTDLAVKMGYRSKVSVSKIESAGDKITLKTIEKLAKALNTTHEYLMGWVESPLPEAVPKAIHSEQIEELAAMAINLEDDPSGLFADMVRSYSKLDEHQKKLILDLTIELAKKKEGH